MSANASFFLLPKTALDELRKTTLSNFYAFLSQRGDEITIYTYSGYIFATLLPYLEEKHQINLMKSEYQELTNWLVDQRKATYFIFTDKHKRAYLSNLDPELFLEEQLTVYFNEFNGINDPTAGEAMLDGFRAFHECLSQLDDQSVVIFGIS